MMRCKIRYCYWIISIVIIWSIYERYALSYIDIYYVHNAKTYIYDAYPYFLFSKKSTQAINEIRDYVKIHPFSGYYPCLIFQFDTEEQDVVYFPGYGDTTPLDYSRKKKGDNIIFCQGSTDLIDFIHEKIFDFQVFLPTYDFGRSPEHLDASDFTPDAFSNIHEFSIYTYERNKDNEELYIYRLKPIKRISVHRREKKAFLKAMQQDESSFANL